MTQLHLHKIGNVIFGKQSSNTNFQKILDQLYTQQWIENFRKRLEEQQLLQTYQIEIRQPPKQYQAQKITLQMVDSFHLKFVHAVQQYQVCIALAQFNREWEKYFYKIKFQRLITLNMNTGMNCIKISSIESLVYLDAPYLHQIKLIDNNIVNYNILSKSNNFKYLSILSLQNNPHIRCQQIYKGNFKQLTTFQLDNSLRYQSYFQPHIQDTKFLLKCQWIRQLKRLDLKGLFRVNTQKYVNCIGRSIDLCQYKPQIALPIYNNIYQSNSSQQRSVNNSQFGAQIDQVEDEDQNQLNDLQVNFNTRNINDYHSDIQQSVQNCENQLQTQIFGQEQDLERSF